MEQYAIKGGNPLVGEVEIGGAKNAALGVLAAAIMTDEMTVIDNLPDVRDINVLLQAMESIGVIVYRIDRHTARINASMVSGLVIEDDYIKKIRASYYLLGALLGKYKHAEVALPGGCNIGSRKIDLHIKGFKALGADVKIEHGLIIADAKEPHVVDVANFLNSMGANVKGAGTDVIRITGVKKLHSSEYSIIPDQIEAGTFMFAAAITRGDVTVKNVIPKHLESTTAKLIEMGCQVEESDDAVRVVSSKRLENTHVKTLPYPGFPTDMQPQIAVSLALAEGTSIVTESIFDNRFKYVDELAKMGSNIKVEGNSAIIQGVEKFTSANLTAPDLRAGAALVLACLTAEGFSTVDDIKYIERGYEDFDVKLQNLGAHIEKVTSDHDLQKFKLKVG